MNIASTTKSRASAQASANVETVTAKVIKSYADGNGNVTSADVMIDGQVQKLSGVTNASGNKLAPGNVVSVNFVKGNRNAAQITGGQGSTAAQYAQSASVATNVGLGSSDTSIDLSGYQIILQAPDAAIPDGYTEAPGANVLFSDAPPYVDGYGNPQNGTRTISMLFSTMTSLPDAATVLSEGTIAPGTIVNLVDSYGVSLGLYRLDATFIAWIRVDVATSITGISISDSLPPASALNRGMMFLVGDGLTVADHLYIGIFNGSGYVMQEIF